MLLVECICCLLLPLIKNHQVYGGVISRIQKKDVGGIPNWQDKEHNLNLRN